MLLFACNAYRVAIRLAKTDKPDVIIASSVHPFTCVAGILAAKKINVPCVAELRDIWPDAIVAVKKINKKNPIIKIMSKIEKWIYIKSDSLIFTVEGGAEYIKNKGWDKYINLNKVHYINNGVCLSEFDKNVNEKPIDDDDLSNDQIFKIVYTGSLRAANGTDLIIKIAEELIKKSDSIKILLWGGGRDKEWLEKQAHEKNLDNMVIKGSVPREYIPYILRSADVNFLHYPEYDNWKYGGSQNKLFEYLASGKPILYDFEFGYNPIKNFEAGIKSATQDPGDIVDAMIYMQKMTQDQKMKMGENARRAANNFDYRKLTDRLITLLLDLQIKFER
jgi:glycosyltransferase involved in cell wall biosynthesis